MKALLPKILDKPEKEIELNLEMLVRAYAHAFPARQTA
jgi:hypothetical protein